MMISKEFEKRREWGISRLGERGQDLLVEGVVENRLPGFAGGVDVDDAGFDKLFVVEGLDKSRQTRPRHEIVTTRRVTVIVVVRAGVIV